MAGTASSADYDRIFHENTDLIKLRFGLEKLPGQIYEAHVAHDRESSELRRAWEVTTPGKRPHNVIPLCLDAPDFLECFEREDFRLVRQLTWEQRGEIMLRRPSWMSNNMGAILGAWVPYLRFFQTSYYVDCDSGSDGGTGAIGDPWLTMDFSHESLAAGDTLNIRASSCTDSARDLSNFTDGTMGSHITVQTYMSETSTWVPTGVECLTVTHANYWDWTSTNQGDMDLSGENLSGGGNCVAFNQNSGGATDLTMTNWDIHDVTDTAGGSRQNIQGFAARITLTDVDCYGTHGTVTGDDEGSHCAYLGGIDNGDDIIVDGGEWRDSGGFGIQLNLSSAGTMTGHIVRNTRIFGNGLRSTGARGGLAVAINVDDALCFNNFIFENNNGPGLYVNGNSGLDCDHNTVHGNAGNNFQIGNGSNVTTARFRNNSSTDAGAWGFQLNASSISSTVTFNHTDGNTSGTIQDNDGGSPTISDNVTGAPNFSSEATDDYTLTASSTPLINAGTDLSGTYATDWEGDSRGTDIGADEFISGGGGSIPIFYHHIRTLRQ